MREHTEQAGRRINTGQLDGANQYVNGCNALVVAVDIYEKERFSSLDNAAQCAFSYLVVDVGDAVIAVQQQCLPLVTHVIDDFGLVGFSRQSQQARSQPYFEGEQQEKRLGLSY